MWQVYVPSRTELGSLSRIQQQFQKVLLDLAKQTRIERKKKEMKHEVSMMTKAMTTSTTRKGRPSKQNQTEFITYAAFKALRQYMKKLKGESPLMSYQQMSTKFQTMEHSLLVLPNIAGRELTLQCLAMNALDLTLPATKVLLKDQFEDFFQLSGHLHSLSLAGPGTVRKRCNGGDENTEHAVYKALCNDIQINFVPQFYGAVEKDGINYIEMENLLSNFENPCVMDIKIGTRTFTESEVSNTKARADLYKKMIAIDPSAPTAVEQEAKAITKLRYMQFREKHSSTSTHGFRIDGIKLADSPPMTDLKTVKDYDSVLKTLMLFFSPRKNACREVVERLVDIRTRIEESFYFQTHEVIGSSVLVIYDDKKVGVWLIDFAKTYSAPKGIRLTHRAPWKAGNHEEGLLFGFDNLISTIEEIETLL